MTTNVIASARKSKGEYKPMIKWPSGRTEIVEQAEERRPIYNPETGTYHRADKYARGTTYANRSEAIAAAQAEIDHRPAETTKRRDEFAKSPNERIRTEGVERVEREMRLFGWKG